MGVFLRHLDRETRRCLDFIKLFPERNIPVFCEERESPSKAEQEARDKIAFLRGMTLDGIPSEPVFLVCHVDRLQIWCEFSLNPEFVEILRSSLVKESNATVTHPKLEHLSKSKLIFIIDPDGKGNLDYFVQCATCLECVTCNGQEMVCWQCGSSIEIEEGIGENTAKPKIMGK